MSFRLIELHRMDDSRDRHMAIVDHGNDRLTVVIVGQYERLQSLGHDDFSAEIELSEIASVEMNIPRNDDESGISEDGEMVVVDGTVHQILQIDDLISVVDVYIRDGPEFIAVTTDDLQGAVPVLDSRLRMRGKGLEVYPTFN